MVEDIPGEINGAMHLSSPNGLAVGPEVQSLAGGTQNTYYVGNFKAAQCTDAATCTPCGPSQPNNWCSTAAENCCEDGALGHLVRFQLPDNNGVARWRTETIYSGETIYALSSGRDGSLLVGTLQGNLYRWDPVALQSTLLHSFSLNLPDR